MAVVVVTLDEARQGQIKHGRSVIAALGHERFGRFELIEPTIPLDDFHDCENDGPEGINDWQRDQDALAACIEAALAETPGEPRP